MPHSQGHDAIVLRTFDVGDADRFCVLLTKSLGRMAVRARGVRKLGSRMGGALMPLQIVQAQLHLRGSHPLATSATLMDCPVGRDRFRAFSRAQRGVELLLTLTEDGEPMPGIYDLTVAFLATCGDDAWDPVDTYFLCLLAQLGLLPTEEGDPRVAHLDEATHAHVLACATTRPFAELCLTAAHAQTAGFLRSVLADHLVSPLRARELALDVTSAAADDVDAAEAALMELNVAASTPI